MFDCDCDGMRDSWEFSQDTRVNTPTLTISIMRSLVTTESQDTRLTSLPKDSTLHRAVSPITALGHWDIFFGPEERVLPPGPPTPLPAESGLPSRNQPEASQQWDAGWYAADRGRLRQEFGPGILSTPDHMCAHGT